MRKPALSIGDLINNGRGVWTVIDVTDIRVNDNVMYEFKHLNTRETKTSSIANMRAMKVGKKLITKHPLYRTYASMKNRCYNTNSHNYSWYGGKGIKICDRWLNSFLDFVSDVGERPKGTTLDRIDGDKDYSPDNCRWATYKEQAQNRK